MALVPMASFGQVRNASYGTGGSSGNQDARQALYTSPSDAEGYGDRMVMPAGYCQSGDGGCNIGDGGCDGGGCYGGGCGGYGGCHGCGPGGCCCRWPPQIYRITRIARLY